MSKTTLERAGYFFKEWVESGMTTTGPETLAEFADRLLAERDAEIERFRTATKAFLQVLDTVTPEIVSRFQFCDNHGFKYKGPTYTEELQLLRDLATEKTD